MPTLPPDPRKAIRDPIYGLIPRTNEEIRLMNTAVFQRLRRIRQLAMAHLVYPGAVHTRFDHSIGTMHVAGRICTFLQDLQKITEQETRIVRLAALLHDIGHGPFSHVSEYLLDHHCKRDVSDDLGTNIHERLTVQLIQDSPEIGGILSDAERQAVVTLLSPSKQRNFKRDIISSSLDADKMDYLLRDSYFAGVKYGTFDLDKIIDACRVHEAGDESYLALHYEGVYAFEQLVMARYHMGQQVYFHRIRAITDALIVRTVNIAIRDKDNDVFSIFQYDGSPDFLERYLKTDDERLLHTLMGSQNLKVSQLSTRLYQRCLLKQICHLSLIPEEVPNAVTRDKLAKLQPETEGARSLEQAIASKLGIDPDFVIVNTRNAGNPTFRSPSYRLDPEEILILDKDNTPKKASQFPVCLASTTAESTQSIQVYAPRDAWNDPEAETTQERDELEHTVRQIIIQHVR